MFGLEWGDLQVPKGLQPRMLFVHPSAMVTTRERGS